MTGPKTFVDVLRDRAASRESGKGFTFLQDGDGLEEHVDYETLDRRARDVGRRLAARARPGERVLLVFDPGLDYVVTLFGCFYAGLVAVPAYPPNPLRPEAGLAQLERVASDSRAALALGSAELLAHLRPLLADAPWARALEWVDLAGSGADRADRLPEVGAEHTAIVQYTSGSTADPKGVVVTHRNLIHNAGFIREAFGLSQSSRAVSWLPPHHDMGLMGGIIQPIFVGIDMVLFSPQLFIQRPLTFLEAITRFRLTAGGSPNFGYELLTRRVPDSAKERLDLSSWEVAFCGAEPVRSSTLDSFAAAFAVCGFRREAFLPCYGLAEATLLVTAVEPSREPRRLSVDATSLDAGQVRPAAGDSAARPFVSCGRPPAGITIRIVDPGSGKPQEDDRTGEIWVKGPNVASGYWNKEAATAASFDVRLDDGEGGYLRTGDLGFMDEGELFITGRLKDLIIIRGRNLHPQDIETTVEHAQPTVRPGRSAVFSAEIDGDERLVVVCEVARRVLLDPVPTQDAVRRAVANAHGIVPHQIVLLEPSRLPRTSSGKPRRALSRERFLAGRLGETSEAFE